MEINQFQIPNAPPKSSSKSRWAILVLILVIAGYALGYKSGSQGYTFEPKEFKVINQENQPQTVDYNLLWDSINIVQNKYIDAPVSDQKILYGAIKGAVESTGDPYTTFFEPRALEDFEIALKGSFEGIGAEIGKRDGNLVIVAPLDDTPADRAGVLAGDIILKVDGQETAGWSTEEAVTKIRGPKGEAVVLNIYREGRSAPFDVSIVRDKIEIKSVTWEYKEAEGKKIAVVRLSRFGEDTQPLFDQAVNDILTQGADGIILDLRNNPGGYLSTAVILASNWISLGTEVVTERHSEGEPTVYNSIGNSRLSGIEIVVLINGGSASASEILAGALQDYGIARLVGEKSFGKGSVQELIDLKDGSAVKVTIAKWFTPNDREIDQEGLYPDVEVPFTEEDFIAGRDPQMDRAMEIISNN